MSSTSASFTPPILWYKHPFKALYITFTLLSLSFMVPYWIIYYTIFSLPNNSWTLRESILVHLIHWLLPLPMQTGIRLMCTDKKREVPQNELKETSFVWIAPAGDKLIRGPAVDAIVKPVKDGHLVGLFIHGGGYMMGNGSESFPETDIARQIYKKSKIKSILSVDYRLTGESCHPGQLLDALAAYAHLVNSCGIEPSRIVIIGACAGGHLALMLTRYLYDEKVLGPPVGLMLFSPWVDMVIDGKMENDPSVKRLNTEIDFLTTSNIPNKRLLGHHPLSLLSSPLMSANLAPPGSYNKYPKTFISVGGCEVFRQECEELEVLMSEDGVDVILDIQAEAVHDFWGFGSLVPSENARACLVKNVVEWIDNLYERQY